MSHISSQDLTHPAVMKPLNLPKTRHQRCSNGIAATFVAAGKVLAIAVFIRENKQI